MLSLRTVNVNCLAPCHQLQKDHPKWINICLFCNLSTLSVFWSQVPVPSNPQLIRNSHKSFGNHGTESTNKASHIDFRSMVLPDHWYEALNFQFGDCCTCYWYLAFNNPQNRQVEKIYLPYPKLKSWDLSSDSPKKGGEELLPLDCHGIAANYTASFWLKS